MGAKLDIMKIDTTGASKETAQPDGLPGGRDSSYRMALTDADTMEDYRDIIIKAGRRWNVDPAIIAGIISRESRAGNQLKNGWGDYGKAWGLMQVDVTPPPNGGGHPKIGAWDSLEHLNHATGILVDFFNVIKEKFPNWTENQQLKGALAAYNKGQDNVHSYENVDAYTTGRDYSNDVVARAQWYKDVREY